MRRPDQEAAAKATEDDVKVFDAGKPPPFRIGDVRAAVPAHCWRKSPWRSLWYVARDAAVVAALAVGAVSIDRWAVWPLYWAAQGTMFWALFVLGHDWYVRTLPLLLLLLLLLDLHYIVVASRSICMPPWTR